MPTDLPFSGDGTPAGLDHPSERSPRTDARIRLRRQLALAVHLVGGCDAASVTVATGRARTRTSTRTSSEASTPSTAAATDEVARAGDELQYRLNEGPCVDAMRRRLLVECLDLGTDPRWPRWSSRVTRALAVNAMISAPLHADHGPGSLNLYAHQASAWDPDSTVLATAIAHLIGLTLAELPDTSPQARAIMGTTTVGQAQTLVMDRYGIDADQALNLLCRAARGHDTSVTNLATRYIDTFS